MNDRLPETTAPETLAALAELLAAAQDLSQRHPDYIAAINRAERALAGEQAARQ